MTILYCRFAREAATQRTGTLWLFYRVNIRVYPQIQRPCFLGSRDRIDSIQNRQQQEKILQKSADKHLFQCYRVKHGRKSCRQQNNPKHTMKSNEGALRPKMAAALLLVLFGKNMEVGSQSQTTVSLAGRIALDDEHDRRCCRPWHFQSRSVQARPQCRFPGVSDRQTDCRFTREIPRLAGSVG